MKKLILVALMGALASCGANQTNQTNQTKSATPNLKSLHLKIGQLFYIDFAGLETALVKDTNQSGVFFTLPGRWLNESTAYISFSELQKQKTFKPLRMYFNKIHIDSTLAKLPIGAKFEMLVAGRVSKYVVCKKSKNSIIVTDPSLTFDQWNMEVPFENFNKKYYKRLR